MTQCTADFEAGTNGATISAADAGSATQWSSVSTTNYNVVAYDNTRAAHGSLSAKLTNGSTGGGGDCLTWSSAALGTISDYYGRFYLYAAANPGATGSCDVLRAYSAGSICWDIRITSAGAIQILDAASVVIATFTTTLPLNQWNRFEYHIAQATGGIEVKLFSADSATATETQTLTGKTLRSSTDQISFRIGSLSTTLWFDDIVAGATSYPGPAATASVSNLALSSNPGCFLHQKGIR